MSLDERLREVRAKRLEVAERWTEKYSKRVGISGDAVQLSRQILRACYREQAYIPHVERLTAAGALYTAAALLRARVKGRKISQRLIARKAGIQLRSVRQAYEHILRTTDIKKLLEQIR